MQNVFPHSYPHAAYCAKFQHHNSTVTTTRTENQGVDISSPITYNDENLSEIDTGRSMWVMSDGIGTLMTSEEDWSGVDPRKDRNLRIN